MAFKLTSKIKRSKQVDVERYDDEMPDDLSVDDTDSTSRARFVNVKTIAASLTGVVLVGVVMTLLATSGNDSNTSGNLTKEPQYQTVLPDGKSITELGGWERVSPPQSEPVYAYNDKIGDVSISVSQQQLPKSFETDTADHVAELAKKFNATNKVDAGIADIYIGTSAKGPQSVIFAKNDLLILIKSQNKIDDKAWVTYVKTLNNLYSKDGPRY